MTDGFKVMVARGYIRDQLRAPCLTDRLTGDVRQEVPRIMMFADDV